MKKLFSIALLCFLAISMQAQNGGTTVPAGYVDLGLPSGTLWKEKNEEGGFYSYDQAVAKFGSSLPTKEQLEELMNSCSWSWTDSGYKVTGPSGASIFLPAAGLRNCRGSVGLVGFGCYWSSTPYGSDNAWYLYYGLSSSVLMGDNDRCLGLSVRLVTEKKKVETRPAVSAVYVDLGLPSGTLWKDKNEEGGFYTYDQAVAKYGSSLPTKEQLEELKNTCSWSWTGSGYKVTGPSGASIILPAAGYRLCGGGVSGVGSFGYYWSSTPYGSDYARCLYFYSIYSSEVWMSMYKRCDGLSVRLVRTPNGQKAY